LGINPAGAAVYRTGEFTITPSFGKTSIDGTFRGNMANDSKYNIGLDNVGYVTTFKTGETSESGLVSISFGLGYNKLGSFSMNSLAEGSNANHSLLTYFTENVNYDDYFDPYLEQLAWDTYLLNYDEVNPWDENGHGRSRTVSSPVGKYGYYNDISDAKYGQSQRKSIDRRGYINEYVLSVAANFNHKFYVGATLGIQDVYFKEDADLYEWDENSDIPYFNDLNFNTYLKTTGNGFNFKLGAIFKPIDQLRLGVAIHTPTFYKFNDVYDSGMSSSITYLSDGETETYSAQPEKEGVYDYEIETPMRAIFSGAYVIGKVGLISVDYELVNYSSSKIKNGSDGDDFVDRNKAIAEAYKTTGNLHIGGEYRLNKNFSLRAGYENFPSVYKASYQGLDNPNSDSSYSSVAAGFGFKQGSFFLDATYKKVMSSEYAKLYPGAIDMAKYETNQNSAIITLGYKF